MEGTGRELAYALGIDDLSKAAKAPSVEMIMTSLNKNVTRSVMGVQLFGTSETFRLPQCQFSALSLKEKADRYN